jgi:hypothetical protein
MDFLQKSQMMIKKRATKYIDMYDVSKKSMLYDERAEFELSKVRSR